MFLSSACLLGMGSGRSISSKSTLSDSIEKNFHTWISDEETKGSNMQHEGIGNFQLVDKEPLSTQTTPRQDSSIVSTQGTIAGEKATAQPAAKRLKREVRKPEPSCLLRHEKRKLPGGKVVAYPVCNLTSAHDKCSSTVDVYGSRACEESHFVKVNDNGVIRLVPTDCSCKI